MAINQSIYHIPYAESGYFSGLICNYLAEQSDLKSFYGRFPSLEAFKPQILEKSKVFTSESREILSEELIQQYAGSNASEATLKNIELLKEHHSFTITTGHQLNLFSGPLYFLYKIITAINLSRDLSNKYPDYNFIPVYWMASEDHDFEEINYFNFRGKKVQWNSDQSGAVGHFDLEGLQKVYDIITGEFGEGKNAEKLKFWFRNAYLEHKTLSEATRYLANELFGEYGLVIIDADSKALKKCFVDCTQKELLHQTAFEKVSQTNQALGNLGYNIQVNPREINLFYMSEGYRERIVEEGSGYHVLNTNISWTESEIIDHLHTYPERFSPNVILRPLYQEVILPNLCYIGGGGELAYWLQLKSNFESNKVPFPILLLRNSALVVSDKQSKKLKQLDIPVRDVFLDRNTFINKRVRQISNIEIDFSEKIKFLEQQFEELHHLAQQTDKSFLGAVKAQQAKQIKGLKKLEKRLLKAQKRKLRDQITRCTQLQEQLFPGQSLQERKINFSEMYLEYGDSFIPELLRTFQPLSSNFTVLTI